MDYDICAEAENGQQAIDLALKHRPDLIILDFAMPVLNGLEAARQLKKIMPGVPIILFTQHATGKRWRSLTSVLTKWFRRAIPRASWDT